MPAKPFCKYRGVNPVSLTEKLTAIKDKSAGQIPDAARAIMARATQQLADSIAEREIPATGDVLPPFSLSDSQGHIVNSRELAENGPCVVALFRGKW